MHKKNDLEKKNISDCTFCVIDFETTGLSGTHNRVIEIGIVKVRKKKIIDTFNSFINPKVKLPEQIKMLTGIQDDDLIDAPVFEDIALKIKSFISESVLVAHNLSFDYSFLYNEFRRAEIELPSLMTLCTLKLSKKLFPDLESKSLGSVVKFMKVRHKNVHRALGDSLATSKILLKMIPIVESKEGIDKIEDLIEYANGSFSKSRIKTMECSNVPQNPGVYFFKNKFDKIIYIGKSKSLRQRINNHFQESASKKSHKIIRQSSFFEFQETKSELSALIKESEMIKEFNPALNKLLKKYPKSYFLLIHSSENFPCPEMTDKFEFDGQDYFGPFVRRDDVQTMINIINKSFELRECNDKTLSKAHGCYLKEIERCVAPCINPSVEIYDSELDKVYDFLSGKNAVAIDRLLKKMKTYSDSKKFEEAADIRDTLKIIMKQIDRTSVLKEPVNKANVLIKITSPINTELILINKGEVIIRDYDGYDSHKFNSIIEDYYNQTIFVDKQLSNMDLNRIRITLSWLLKNRNNYKLFYLKDYSSCQEFLKAISH